MSEVKLRIFAPTKKALQDLLETLKAKYGSVACDGPFYNHRPPYQNWFRSYITLFIEESMKKAEPNVQ